MERRQEQTSSLEPSHAKPFRNMSSHPHGWGFAVLSILMIAGMGQLHLSNNQLHVRLESMKGNVDEILAISRRKGNDGAKAGHHDSSAAEPTVTTRRTGRELLSSDEDGFGSTILSSTQVKTPIIRAATIDAWAISINGTNLISYLNFEFDEMRQMLLLLVGSLTKNPTSPPTPLPTSEPTPFPTPLPTIHVAPGHVSSKPATSGMVILGQGDPSGTYWIKPTGSSATYQMYVDNDRNGGGWVLVARVTVASCQAHSSNGAVNFDGTNGPSKTQTSTTKVADTWIQALRSGSTYTGTTAYWMESTSTWNNGATEKHVFIDTRATVDLTASANTMDYRTYLSTTFEGTLDNRDCNSGTRGFGACCANVGAPCCKTMRARALTS